jgi:hypothetical protein
VSSSLDSALVDTATIEDPRLVVLPRGIRLLAIEALVWSKLHRTDGFLPATAILRMTDEPDPWGAAARLTEAGVWEGRGDSWQIVGFTETQMSAARVREKQAAAKVRYDRWQQAHMGARRVANGVTNDSARPAPPARKGGGQVGGDEAAAVVGAAVALEVDNRPAEPLACQDYRRHQSHHRLFSEGWRCDLCDRRRLAASIREASPAYKPRLLRAWQSSYGHLYGKRATA